MFNNKWETRLNDLVSEFNQRLWTYDLPVYAFRTGDELKNMKIYVRFHNLGSLNREVIENSKEYFKQLLNDNETTEYTAVKVFDYENLTKHAKWYNKSKIYERNILMIKEAFVDFCRYLNEDSFK